MDPPKSGLSEDILKGMKQVMVDLGLDKLKQDTLAISESIKALQTSHTNIEKSLTDTVAVQDAVKHEVGKLQTQNTQLLYRVTHAENKCASLEKSMLNLKDELLELKSRSMRDNLVFNGIPEERSGNTLKVLIHFLQSTMKVPVSSFKLSENDSISSSNLVWVMRCHRLGQVVSSDKPRPIVAHFLKGKEYILSLTRHLAGTKFFVSVQLPPEVNEEKRKLLPLFKTAKSEGKKPKFVGRGDSLLIDKRILKPPKLPPSTITPSEVLGSRSALNVQGSKVFEEKGNKFLAHKARTHSIQDVSCAIEAIKYSHHSIATATHNMYAARVSVGQSIHEYCDDDGEFSGSREILNIMREKQLTDQVIVVTRWYNGTQLGAKRFSMIRKVVLELLAVQPIPPSMGNGESSS